MREVGLLQQGDALTLDSAGAPSLRILPGLDTPFKQLADATADYGHLCCEQTAAKILAAAVMWLTSEGRGRRKKAETVIVAGIAREKTMWRRGRLAIRPRYPQAGRTLQVVFEQPVRTGVFVRGVDLTLIAERTTVRVRGGRSRHKTVRVVRQRLCVPVEGRAWPGTTIRAEGAFDVSPEGVPGGGFLRWRVEGRTRLFGPDYATRFPIGAPDEDDEDGDDAAER